MDIATVSSFIAATIAAGTPILYAALGEILTERAGVLNLGLEGMMLVGGMAGFAAASLFLNPWMGLIAALIAGAILGLGFGVLCISLRANQIVSGLALATFGIGLSAFLGKSFLGRSLSTPFKAYPVPVLSKIPLIGEAFFNHDALIYISYFLVILFWYWIFRTRPGLHMRTVGENPRAGDTLGVNVSGVRYLYTMLGGALVAVGGAYLTLAYVPSWLENITAGRGWIALAVVIFSGWNPLSAVAGAYLFGGVNAFALYVQAFGSNVPTHFLGMAPYLMTIIVLILATRGKRAGAAPSALGVPYDREEK
jgi:general nucleoside transport system permease protein